MCFEKDLFGNHHHITYKYQVLRHNAAHGSGYEKPLSKLVIVTGPPVAFYNATVPGAWAVFHLKELHISMKTTYKMAVILQTLFEYNNTESVRVLPSGWTCDKPWLRASIHYKDALLSV